MHYTTVTVDIEQGDEAQAQAIDDAIAQGCTALSKEVGGPVELVNVVPVDTPDLLCLTIMVRPYQPVNLESGASILQAMKALNWGPERTKA